MRYGQKLLCGALALGMSLPASALALDDAAVLEQLKAMQAQIDTLQKQVTTLNRELAKAKSQAAVAEKTAVEAKARSMQIVEASPSADRKETVDTGNLEFSLSPGPTIKTADGETVFRIGGFAQIDMGHFFDDMADYSTGATVRRARLNASGTIARDWKYKLENDFANNASTLTDVYVEYAGFKPLAITVGQFKEPFSLETLTPDLFTTFVERASPTIFSPDRNIGIAVSSNGKLGSAGAYTITVGAFGSGTGTASTDDEAKDVAGRITLAPLAEKDQVLHFGVAGVHRVPDATNDQMRFSSRPETQLSNAELVVDTGNVTGIDHTNLLGLEAAGVYGPASLQGEYIMAQVDRQGNTASATLGGYYVEASYFLTGESRNYKNGKFDRVSPKQNFTFSGGGMGAWQVAARYSSLDLNDGPITGGEMDNITLGLKWIPHPHVLFNLNYIMVDSDTQAVVAHDKPRALVLRSQVDF